MSLLRIARDAGLDVTDARVTARPGAFEPIGVLVHHTAGADTGDMPSLRLLREGRDGIPGPLTQFGLGRTGRAYVICDGRASHAGKGSSAVLVRARRDAVPGPHGGLNDTDGNAYFIGIETENNGRGQAYPVEQYAALVVLCAALCRAYGWSANRVVAHREWTDRKIDPRGVDMDVLRADVRAAMEVEMTPAQMTELKAYIKQAVRVTVAAALFGTNTDDDGAWLRDDAEPWTSPLPNLRAIDRRLTSIEASVAAGDGGGGGDVNVDAIAQKVADVLSSRLRA